MARNAMTIFFKHATVKLASMGHPSATLGHLFCPHGLKMINQTLIGCLRATFMSKKTGSGPKLAQWSDRANSTVPQ